MSRIATGHRKEHGLRVLANDFPHSREDHIEPGPGWSHSVPQGLRFISLAPLLVTSLAACEASQKEPVRAKTLQPTTATQPVDSSNRETTVSEQQIPINRQFRNLDEY